MLTGLGLVVLSSAFVLVDRASVTGFMPVREYKPAWLLMAEAYALGDRRASIATDEIVRRINLGELNKKHNDRLVSISLARHAQTWRSFPDAQWMVITEAIAARELTTAQVRLVLDNLIEDGFVLGFGEGDWDLFKSTGDYKAYPIRLGPGEWTRLSVGVKFRAGQQSTLAGSSIIWYLDTGVQLAVHEFPDLEHSPGLGLGSYSRFASVLRVFPGVGQIAFDDEAYIRFRVPWMDGEYTGTATYLLYAQNVLRLASDYRRSGNESISIEIPVEFEVSRGVGGRFPVLDAESLSNEAPLIDWKSMPWHGHEGTDSQTQREYFLILKQDAGVDWEKTAIAGHLVFRQGERVERVLIDQGEHETRRVDFDHRPLTRNAFAPGEVHVSYEHNEALAAFKYSNDESRYENVLGGPIELGTIVIPGSDETERVEQPE